jgi:phytoene dehydrogenase-like protein
MEKKKSVAIVGAGLAGLSAGITWLTHHDAEGDPAVILEKNSVPGGYVTTYERRGYHFDTVQLSPDIRPLLDQLGVEGVSLEDFGEVYMKVFLTNGKGDHKTLEVHHGLEAFREHLAERYPEEEDSIGRFLDICSHLHEELYEVKLEPGALDMIKMLFKCPTLVKSRKKTLEDYFDECGIESREVRTLLGSFCAFAGLPPSKVSALIPMLAVVSLCERACRPVPHFRSLIDAMVERYLELGGELRLSTEVVGIRPGDPLELELQGGGSVKANRVISTIDPKLAMLELVGGDVLSEADPGYARRVGGLEMSYSTFNIELALDGRLDLDRVQTGYGVLTTGGDVLEKMFEKYQAGEPWRSREEFSLGVVSQSHKTGGAQTLTLRVSPSSLEPWDSLRRDNYKEYKKAKEEYADFVIGIVEEHLIPGLSEHIVYKDLASPATYKRYSGSPTGSLFDIAPYPDQSGLSSLGLRTPIEGLYQTKFIHGILGAILAGLQVNDVILDGSVLDGYSRLALSRR